MKIKTASLVSFVSNAGDASADAADAADAPADEGVSVLLRELMHAQVSGILARITAYLCGRSLGSLMRNASLSAGVASVAGGSAAARAAAQTLWRELQLYFTNSRSASGRALAALVQERSTPATPATPATPEQEHRGHKALEYQALCYELEQSESMPQPPERAHQVVVIYSYRNTTAAYICIYKYKQ